MLVKIERQLFVYSALKIFQKEMSKVIPVGSCGVPKYPAHRGKGVGVLLDGYNLCCS